SFRNKSFCYILRATIKLSLNDNNNAIIDFNKALDVIDNDTIYNENEQKYLKIYIYYNLAIIYKFNNQKDKSIAMIKEYKRYGSFNINKVRTSLLYDFQLQDNEIWLNKINEIENKE
ncbi:MAG: hypothetical protein GY932_09515, partial [Arcobacter sp.]|nr:hypothetical protein [Arcobacter sp.]